MNLTDYRRALAEIHLQIAEFGGDIDTGGALLLIADILVLQVLIELDARWPKIAEQP